MRHIVLQGTAAIGENNVCGRLYSFSIAETWRTVQMKWPRVKGDRIEQHREVVTGLGDEENREWKTCAGG